MNHYRAFQICDDWCLFFDLNLVSNLLPFFIERILVSCFNATANFVLLV